MIATTSVIVAWAVWLAAAVAGMALGSLYGGIETGLYVLNKIRLELRAEAGSRTARFLRAMLRDPNDLLAALLIGTNLTQYVATFAITSMFLLAGSGPRAQWYTIALVTPMMFVVVDAVPKNVFRRAAETLTYRVAWLLRASEALFRFTGLTPLVRGTATLVMRLLGVDRWAQSPLAHQGVSAIVAEGHASGLLTHSQSIMADRVMRLRDVALRDAMRPMREVVSAPAGAGCPQVLQIIRDHNYSRVPMVDATGQVVGVLDVFDVLSAEDPVAPAEVMAPPLVLPADTGVTEALYRMQRTRTPLAVVADPNGRHVGIATVKDLVEEIVGELEAW